MIESLLSVVGQRGVDALAFLLAFALTALMDSVFHDKLPHDHGREFAVNGALSKGKARGSGLIFVLCIALVSLAAEPAGKLHEYKPVGYQRLVDELTMLVKQLTWQLRKAKPDCKLPDKAMSYLERNGLISVEDILR